MNEYLKKIIAEKERKISNIRTKVDASQDADEVRSLTAEMQTVRAELDEARNMLQNLEKDQRSEGDPVQPGTPIPASAQQFGTRASFEMPAEENRAEDPFDTEEYRNAFKKYVQTGEMIPAELRNGKAVSTKETGVMIPTTVMNQVINTLRKSYGTLYTKVRKVSVAGGVELPIGSLEAEFKWINESTVSPRQRVDELAKITFKYHPAEIRVAQTFLSELLTLSAFEAEMSTVIAKAYLKAMDKGIMLGEGKGSMLGILKDPRVANQITMPAANISKWASWKKDFFAKLPLGYRAGEFIFPQSTVEGYLDTMADSNNRPIFVPTTALEANSGDISNVKGRFFGRDVTLVEPDIIPDFDLAATGDVIGLYWQPEEYTINENFGFSMRRYFDEETNEWVDKALTVVDGKVANPTGFYKIIKG